MHGSDGAVTDLSIEGGVLSYTGGESIVEGQEYEITVPVNGGNNYENYDITVTLTGTDKQVLDITGVTAQGGTYNGPALSGLHRHPQRRGALPANLLSPTIPQTRPLPLTPGLTPSPSPSRRTMRSMWAALA